MQKKFKTKYVLIILTFGLVLLLTLNSNLFSIKKVEVFVTNRLDCVNQTQLTDSSMLIGKNIFLFDNEELTRKIKEKYICVKNVTLTKNFVDKVEINVSGRKGAAYLMATPSALEATPSFLIDEEGVVFSKGVNNLSIPTIFVNITSFSLGQKLEGTNEILKILDKIKSYGLDEKISEIEGSSFIIHSNPKTIFNLAAKVEGQLASLQLILNKAKINAEELEFIDLRFDKPVIRIAPKKNG